MSQRSFKAEFQGCPVEVMMGWDRPEQEFFLMVKAIGSGEQKLSLGQLVNHDGYVYHSVFDDHVPKKREQQLAYFQSQLIRFGLSVPGELMAHLESDQLIISIENKIVRYQEDGSEEETS